MIVKKSFFLLAAFLISAPIAAAGETYGNLDGVQYVRNYDGDTITVNIPGVHPLLGDEIAIRVDGIDTPEIKGKCERERRLAREAKAVVARLLVNAKSIRLVGVGRGKYFRITAHVVADGVDVGDELLRRGLAVPYDGGRKSYGWCFGKAVP